MNQNKEVDYVYHGLNSIEGEREKEKHIEGKRESEREREKKRKNVE